MTDGPERDRGGGWLVAGLAVCGVAFGAAAIVGDEGGGVVMCLAGIAALGACALVQRILDGMGEPEIAASPFMEDRR